VRAIHLIVRGRVQGVGFRYFIRAAADDAGVVGFVRNLPEGEVEIRAEGAPEALERLAEAARRGPRHASVTRVERRDEDASGAFERFEVRS